MTAHTIINTMIAASLYALAVLALGYLYERDTK
jgi:hypothetical protein